MHMSHSTDRPPDPDQSDPDRPGTNPGSGRGAKTGAPRWVKIFGIIAITVLVVLVVVGLFTGGHGPGRHTTGLGGPTQPTSVTVLGG
jgi:hypothetical protein